MGACPLLKKKTTKQRPEKPNEPNLSLVLPFYRGSNLQQWCFHFTFAGHCLVSKKKRITTIDRIPPFFKDGSLGM